MPWAVGVGHMVQEAVAYLLALTLKVTSTQMGVSTTQGPVYRPQYTMILVVSTPKKGLVIHGHLQMLFLYRGS